MWPLCLNTSTIRPQPLREKIEVAARAGYDMIELWCDDVETYLRDGGTLAALRAHLQHTGLRVPSMIALKEWADAASADLPDRLRQARERLELAAALECPRLVASPPFRQSVDLAVVAERYRMLLDLGRRIGTMPAMEFLGFVPQINTLRICLEILARADDPDAVLVLDPFHIFRGGGSFDEVLLVPGRQIGICHFNDAPADKPRETQTDADRVLPGEGCLPLGGLLRALRAVHYHGPLSLELFHPELWAQDPLEVAREGARRMRALIQEADG